MAEPIRIIITGEHEDLATRAPRQIDGRDVEWRQLPVLRFERLPVKPDLVERLVKKPVDWIVFTSSRAVHFWSEVLLENGVDFPLETQVACIGEQTAQAASQDGYTPDFYPTEPGTECFLEEFEDLVNQRSERPSVFLPVAQSGRPTLRDRLRELGCDVLTVPLYRTLAREDLGQDLKPTDIERADLVLFTSPSSVDAFIRVFDIPAHVKIASIGRYTATHLQQKGFSDQRTLPEGDLARLAEVLA